MGRITKHHLLLCSGGRTVERSRLRSWGTGFAFVSLLTTTAMGASGSSFQDTYGGSPYQDSHHTKGVQQIPGRVECAYYDRGGEGVAYHDSDAKNNGSGGLNPADGSYLNEFRMNE